MHQIDVLTSHTDGAHKYLTIIECKHWNKRIQKGTINKVAYIRQDCKFDKAIVVSNKGFTKGAMNVAKDQNVHLVELAENNVFISQNSLTRVYMHTEYKETKIENIEFELNRSGKKYSDKISLQNQNWAELTITKPDFTTITILDEVAKFLNNILDHIENFEVQHLNLKFDEGSTIKFKGLKTKFLIDGIKLSGYKTARIILDPDYFTNRIWLTMKLLFEQKNMVFTLDGRVEPQPTSEPLSLFKGQRAKITLHASARQFKVEVNPEFFN
jgi:hypothetical protein